jgi:hypothetical protein
MANRFLDSRTKYNRLWRFHQSSPANHSCGQGAGNASVQLIDRRHIETGRRDHSENQ